MNKIIVSGNLTRDPERFEAKNAKTVVTRFTVAVNAFENGEKTATYFPCVAFDKQAEAIAKYCKKGNKVCIIGTLKRTSYTNPKTNETKDDIEIVVAECEFCSTKD